MKVIEELMELKSRIIVKKEIKDDNIAKFEKNEIFEIKKIANKCGAKIKIYKYVHDICHGLRVIYRSCQSPVS